MSQYILVILEFGRWKQEGLELKGILGHTERHCLNKPYSQISNTGLKEGWAETKAGGGG